MIFDNTGSWHAKKCIYKKQPSKFLNYVSVIPSIIMIIARKARDDRP